jgi:hypothetical protein
MSTLTAPKRTAHYDAGFVTVRIAGTVEIRFPITASPRLTKGTEAQLKNIEVSPFGLHWPELDEDLSFKGILNGELSKSKTAPPQEEGFASSPTSEPFR